MNKKILLIDILIVIVLFLLGFSVFLLVKNYYNNNKINNLLNNINYENYKEEISNLKKINKDIVGIVEIDNTEYRAFFVQGKDNKEYLRRNIYKQKDKNGTAFLDYRVDMDSKKIIIYGHNSRYVDMPFNFLDNYNEEDFYNNHKIINVITENNIAKFEVISVFTETSDWSYQDIDFDDEKDFESNIKKLVEKSIYNSYYKNDNKQILVLQTCSTRKEYKGYARKFLIIVARRIV